jgi:hypothetical protein
MNVLRDHFVRIETPSIVTLTTWQYCYGDNMTLEVVANLSTPDYEKLVFVYVCMYRWMCPLLAPELLDEFYSYSV